MLDMVKGQNYQLSCHHKNFLCDASTTKCNNEIISTLLSLKLQAKMIHHSHQDKDGTMVIISMITTKPPSHRKKKSILVYLSLACTFNE